MAYSLRLPSTLDAASRAKADYLGISLNSLVCVALDAYLCRPAAPAPAGTDRAALAEKPTVPDAGSPELPAPVDVQPVAPAKPAKVGWRERQRERDTAFR